MPDENDIVINTYQGPDLIGVFRGVYDLFGGQVNSFDSFIAWLIGLWEIWTIIAFSLSALFIFGLIYVAIRTNQLAALETEQLKADERLWRQINGGQARNNRWLEIEGHLNSTNPNDWKLAIIEADVWLDEIVTNAGYAGQSLGEKLKSASSESFTTLDDAWKAHRARNAIAHGHSDFVLTQRVAQETILKYKRVFQEFGAV